MKALNVIPEPKKILLKEGTFSLDKSCVIEAKGMLSLAKFLQREIKAITKINLSYEENDLPKLEMRIAKKVVKNSRKKRRYNIKGLGEEGYIVDIELSMITIVALQTRGLFYGIQTLLQLLEDNRKIKCCYIKDWPDMKLRGIHIDLKGSMPTFEYLKEIIKQLSRYKINMILVEYEDKFKYEKHPIINSPVALSKEQIKELIEIAEAHYIQVIPLLQCLGHAEYVLRHKEYENLAEGKGKTEQYSSSKMSKEYEYISGLADEIEQYCPSNPKTLTLLKELSSEIIPLHKSRYFHIGGDETYLLGKCEKCKERVKKSGFLRLYLDHINKVCNYLKKNGKIPIIWDDMISRGKQPELIKELDKDVIIMYWDYSAIAATRPFLRWQGTRCSKRWLEKRYARDYPEVSLHSNGWIEDIPKKILKTYRKYWFNKEYPLFANSLPYIRFFQDKEHYVMGASEVRGGKVFPDFERYLLNIREWARQISKNKGLGMVSTSWGRNASLLPPAFPFELTWYLLLASAEYYWSANKTTEKEFDRKFNLRFYGLNNQNVTDAIHLLDKANKGGAGIFFLDNALRKMKEAENKAKRNILNIQSLEIVCRMFEYRVMSKRIFSEIETRYYQIKGGHIVNCEKKRLLAELKKIEEMLPRLKREIRKALKQTMPISEVEEFLKSEYSLDEEKIRKYRKEIRL